MCEADKWSNCFQDFVEESNNVFEESKTTNINIKGEVVTHYKLYADHETLEWDLNKNTLEIEGVKYLGR